MLASLVSSTCLSRSSRADRVRYRSDTANE